MSLYTYIKSSIGRKQIVAITGLLLILFVVGHLAGNLILMFGPEAYNHYAQKLAGLRPALYVVEIGLTFVFLIHILVTYWLVLDNIRARPIGYNIYEPSGGRSWATRLMPYTGTILVAFVIYHLMDFTFIDHGGARSILRDGRSYELYGVVYNSFVNLPHSLFYIVAMMCLGLHLSHGIHSFCQTFGFEESARLRTISSYLGFTIAVLYSSIPIYVLIHNRLAYG